MISYFGQDILGKLFIRDDIVISAVKPSRRSRIDSVISSLLSSGWEKSVEKNQCFKLNVRVHVFRPKNDTFTGLKKYVIVLTLGSLEKYERMYWYTL